MGQPWRMNRGEWTVKNEPWRMGKIKFFKKICENAKHFFFNFFQILWRLQRRILLSTSSKASNCQIIVLPNKAVNFWILWMEYFRNPKFRMRPASNCNILWSTSEQGRELLNWSMIWSTSKGRELSNSIEYFRTRPRPPWGRRFENHFVYYFI